MFENTKAFSAFSVDDIDAARKFYGEVLGVPATETDGTLRLHVGGDTEIFVYPKGADHVPATFTILNFPTDDIEGAVKSLSDRGVRFERLPGVEEDGILRRGDGEQIAWFKDPAGNWLALLQQ